MDMQDHILTEIKRLAAANDGVPPGARLCEKETGIKRDHLRGKLWARWSDVVADAGFPPNTANSKLNPDTVLDCLGEVCLHHQHFPTDAEWKMYARGKPDFVGFNSYRKEFGGREGAIAALRKRATERGEKDLLEILPYIEGKAVEAEASPSTGNFARLQEFHHFVYLIESSNQNLYKIGQAKNVEQRIVTLRNADSSIELVHKIKTRDPSVIEKYWHDLFCEQRRSGEWFALNRSHVKYFKSFERQ